MSKKDYRKLYRAQDYLLGLMKKLDTPFYLTGGTALGRFYLNHRYSLDLDFFVNANDRFTEYIQLINRVMKKNVGIDYEKSLVGEEFARFIVKTEELLKVEFVNDIKFRYGIPCNSRYGLIDNVRNILSNKIGAIVSREEAKAICDIYFIAMNYRFNWAELIAETKEKIVINELDIAQKINEFPVELLDNVDWIISKPDLDEWRKKLTKISDDILLGKDNSFGVEKVNISKANITVEKKGK